jgi:hypothetical protein
MTIQYTQDSSPTNPFGVGWYEQAVDTSKRLVAEREAKELELANQLNNGPYTLSNIRAARKEYQALAENTTADPAAVAAAKAKLDELQATRSDLNAQSEQNSRLLEQTRDGLRNNEIKLAEASAKAINQPPNRPIVNAGNDPAANSTPPVVSPTDITGAVPPAPPLNVTTPASLSPPAVSTSGDQAFGNTATDAEQQAIAAATAPEPVPNDATQAEQYAIAAAISAPEPVPNDATQAEQDAIAAAIAANQVQTDNPAPVSPAQSERDDAAAVDAANQTRSFSPAPVPPNQTGYNGTAYDDEGNLNPGWTLDENNNPVFVGGNFVIIRAQSCRTPIPCDSN